MAYFACRHPNHSDYYPQVILQVSASWNDGNQRVTTLNKLNWIERSQREPLESFEKNLRLKFKELRKMLKKREEGKNIVEETSGNVMIPRVSLGGICLGVPINQYLSREDCELVQCLGSEWYYFQGGSISVWLEDGIIRSITCEENVVWNGHQIIGMKISDFIKIFNLHVEDCDRMYVHDAPRYHTLYFHSFFEPLGLYVWTWRKRIIQVDLSKNYLFDDSE